MNTDIAAYVNGNIEHPEISRLHLFKGANLLSIDGLLNTCPVLNLEAGKTLICAGQPNQVLYFLLAGRLRVHEESPQNEPISAIEPGECIGVAELLDRSPSAFHVLADEASRLLAVDEDRLIELINSSHVIARNFFFLLMRTFREKRSPHLTQECQTRYKRPSSVDDLTGLHNRRWLDEMLTRQIMRSSTSRQPLSVLMVGIDKLKEFNSEFGMILGDQAVYIIGQTLMKNARPTDMIARYEGNKFTIILPGTDIDGARVCAARLREVVSETNIEVPNQCILPPLTISSGITQLKAFVAAESLLSDAFAALARAKEHGGNWVSE